MTSTSHSMLLDLHGRRVEDAISEVTLFLDRIRRTHSTVRASMIPSSKNDSPAESATGAPEAMRDEPLYVVIVTGSGSHGSQGPVLRNAVKKLLQKRGMNFSLGRCGGAFQVDALSGWDLYDEEQPTDSKVLLMDQEQFNQMATVSRSGSVGCSLSSLGEGNLPPHSRSTSAPDIVRNNGRSFPLPSEVAAEDAALQAAVHISIRDSQKHRNLRELERNECETAFRRAISESQAEHVAQSCRQRNEEIEVRKALALAFQDFGEGGKGECPPSIAGAPLKEEHLVLKKVAEQSLIDEQKRNEEAQERYEQELEAILKQSELSASEEKRKAELEEETMLKTALEKSLMEEEKVKSPDEELVEMIKAQSLKETEMRKLREEEELERALVRSIEESNQSDSDELLEKALRLSLEEKSAEPMDEETAVRIALELSVRNENYFDEDTKMPARRV
eukprot:CAMPEP_0171413594 /NCGR_PEP_ID=MMETSP0880-20121228/35432_1 /TAXON_ID=67004 /ORGANISM="Thalassiosira weissflogii, Strain CCMP1336" /LENGTH=447 /DNA_ID=CAMNT_0011931313 /DNA_START=74 /DNA_END=1417 /DNA_ORIENTATION=-